MFHLNRLLIFVLLLLVFSCSGNKKEEIVIEEKDLEMQMIEAYEAGVKMFEEGDKIFAAKSKVVIQKMLKRQKCDFEDSKLSKREWNELMESFGFKEKML